MRRAKEREDLWGDARLPGARWGVVESVGVHRDVVLAGYERAAVGGAFVCVVGDDGGHGEEDGERGGGE